MAEIISFDDFKKTELKVAKILSAEDIPGKDKLYKLEIEIGEEKPRILFAGLKPHYEKEFLIGKQIIVVANLQPRKLGPIESQGMLLAVDVDDKPILIFPEKEVPEGSIVR